jgi:hypothetical protein
MQKMHETKFDAVIVYSDSTSLPRVEFVKPAETWPSFLNSYSDAIYVRSRGGITSKQILRMLKEDSIYLSHSSKEYLRTLVIFAFGIVDCAPQPITYRLKIIQRLPFIGRVIWRLIRPTLIKCRKEIQGVLSYRPISPKRFRTNLIKMIESIENPRSQIIVIGTPIPSNFVLNRSPGFFESVILYNKIKEEVSSKYKNVIFVDMGRFITNGYISEKDGHHFSEIGHRNFADILLKKLDSKIDP